jgi:hypothetical protein
VKTIQLGEVTMKKPPTIAPFIKKALPLFVLLIVAGCAHSSFTPSTTINGAVIRDDAILPIYLSPPTAPYDVIGTINVETSRLRNPDKVASQQAIQRGANALILINEDTIQVGTEHSSFGNTQTYGNTTIYEGTGVSVPIRRKSASYLAIKLK